MFYDINFMNLAIEEAKKSLKEGGIPIGAVLVKDNEVLSKGHNRLIQKGSVILHAELDAIENAGRLSSKDYKHTTLYTTLSPCPMCSGAILLYNIPRVVIGENITLMGSEQLLKDNNVEIIVLDIQECKDLFSEYIHNNPSQWDKELDKVGNSTNLF
jgi:creatinine deaminase